MKRWASVRSRRSQLGELMGATKNIPGSPLYIIRNQEVIRFRLVFVASLHAVCYFGGVRKLLGWREQVEYFWALCTMGGRFMFYYHDKLWHRITLSKLKRAYWNILIDTPIHICLFYYYYSAYYAILISDKWVRQKFYYILHKFA